jgi:6,7-dimethyl-8-ribityllumazine synthase
MAGGLPKPQEAFHKIPGAKLAIIASMWHSECVEAMVERAKLVLLDLEVREENIAVHRLPGSLELPYAAARLFETDSKLDAVLAFGVVLTGATTHDATVIQNVVQGFSMVSEKFGKPIINEVIGVTDIEDAKKRSGDGPWNKGLEAAFAVSELLHWQKSLQ